MVRAILVAITFCVAGAVHAANERAYAVISIVGDKFTIVRARMSTGTNLRRNDRQAVAFPDPVIDRTALLAVERALRKQDKEAKPILMLVQEPRLLSLQDRLLEEGAPAQELFEGVRRAVAEAQATHLILVSKLRHEAILRFESSSFGTGRLEGVGFYIDDAIMSKRSDTHETARGALAPFAYFRLSLFDVASGQLIREEEAVASTTASAARAATLDPWDAMNSQQKIEALRRLVSEEIDRKVPLLLQSP